MVLVEMVRKKMRRERMHPSKEEGLMTKIGGWKQVLLFGVGGNCWEKLWGTRSESPKYFEVNGW